jgi:acetylornithine/succinyldiaminopimelate/putrescine aminotransferase
MASIKMSAEQKKQEEKWAIQDAIRTVQSYNDLMKNKQLMNKARTAAMEQVKMLGGVIGSKPTPKKKK